MGWPPNCRQNWSQQKPLNTCGQSGTEHCKNSSPSADGLNYILRIIYKLIFIVISQIKQMDGHSINLNLNANQLRSGKLPAPA
jgi:hypothetical protein